MNHLFQSLKTAVGNSVDAYRRVRRQIFWIIWIALILAVFAVALNFLGFRTVNTIIGCILPILGVYIASSPAVLGWAMGLGVITSLRHPVSGAKNAAEILASWLEQVLFLLGFFFLAAGTIPLGRNFWGVAIVILCLGLLIVQGKGVNHRWANLYVALVLIFTIASMVPAPVHKKVYGHDLFSWSRISPIEDANTRIENAEIEANEKKIVAFLAVIEKKIKKGQELTTSELTLKAYAKALQDGNTAPAKAKEAWENLFPAKPDNTPSQQRATAMSSGKSLTVELQPDQVYDVDDLRQRQSWSYTAFNGSFYQRVDKGDNNACWKVVNNNLPWFADCAGKLQVKAGNTPVKLTVNVLP